jgi:hypothetical protein
MFFRKTNVRCIDCGRFVPTKDNPKRGTCHIIEIADATLPCDCRWFEPLAATAPLKPVPERSGNA